jgi:hypothetical protein
VIAIAHDNGDLIWVGHNNGDVFVTTNGTNSAPTWTQVDTNGVGLSNRYVTSIAIDPLDANTVYVSFGGFEADNVWRTPDAGLTWVQASGIGATALLSVPVNSIVVHPAYGEWVYAGTEIGVFASEDRGETWSVFNQAPSNVAVDQLFWTGRHLAAATFGRGVYRTTDEIGPIFVASYGTDFAGCGDWTTQACRTVQFAVDTAQSGETIVILAGTYSVPTNYVVNKNIKLRATQGTALIVAP